MTIRFGFLISAICGVAAMPPSGVLAQATHFRVERLSPAVREAFKQRYEARRGPEQTEKFSKTIKAGRGAMLDLQCISGSITVTGASGDDIVIEAVKRVRARDEARGKAILNAIEVQVVERPMRVTVRTLFPRTSGSISAAVDFTVRVPQDAAVDLMAIAGDLRVTNVRGELRLETVNGTVRAGQSPRLAFAKSVSGNVEITGAIDGELSASSLSGAVLLTDVRARALELTTVTGDVVLNSVLGDRIRVRAVNGNVQVLGPLSPNGRYDINSHAGGVRFMLPSTSGLEIDAGTFSGNVRSDLPLRITTTRSSEPPSPPSPPSPPTPPRPPSPRNPRDNARERAVTIIRGRVPVSQFIRGMIGDANAYVLIRTFSGDIVLESNDKKPK